MTLDAPTVGTVLLPVFSCWVWSRTFTTLHPLERCAVAIGCGVALPSLAFFGWRLIIGDPAFFRFIDPLVWLALGMAGVLRHGLAFEFPARSWLVTALSATGILWAALVVTTGWLVTVNIMKLPMGEWDAWAIWNMRAAFLAVPSEHWRDGFTPLAGFSPLDYPLLLPAAVSRAWVVTGTQTDTAPVILGLAFLIGSVLLIMGALSRKPSSQVLAAVALLLSPMFVTLGTSQCADVPLAFYALAAATFLRYDSSNSRVLLILAGAFAGCAAWTKNEGLVVALSLPAVYVVARWQRDALHGAKRAFKDLILGLAPMLIVLALYKVLLSPPNDLLSATSSTDAIMRLQDSQRIRFVAEFMVREALAWGGWPIGGPIWVVLFLGFLQLKRDQRRHAAAIAAGVTLLIRLAVFFAVYVLTPYNLLWHLSTSWFRLVAQMWPTFVWWAFARDPSADASSTASG